MTDEQQAARNEKPAVVAPDYIVTKLASGEWKNVRNRQDEFVDVKTGDVLHYNRGTGELVKLGDSEFKSGDELKPAPKKPFVLNDEALVAFAEELKLPKAAARMFFMVVDNTLYVKIAGLLALAVAKRPYQAIQIPVDSIKKNEQGEWSATCYVYPKITARELHEINTCADPVMRKQMWDYMTMPTAGYGRAGRDNVKLPEVRDKFLPEMAQTRAVARALRLYTGFGFTAAEEMQEGIPDMSVEGYRYVPSGPEVRGEPIAGGGVAPRDPGDATQAGKTQAEAEKKTEAGKQKKRPAGQKTLADSQ